MKKGSLLLVMQLLFVVAWSQVSLRGIVKDQEGEALPGASVMIRDTYSGVSTGSDGRFEFKNLKPGKYRLAVSFIGFETAGQEVELTQSRDIEVVLTPTVVYTGEVVVSATLAGDKTPVAYVNITGEEIRERNFGQDIPYLLALSPSFVATSDAGAGIGYTNFRIRGTDLNRINVTVNGIPLNDSESHGTWFVDQPDLAGSTNNIQIQRGVGTSTNGAASFGATINLQTLALNPEPYAEIRSAGGSFNTLKNTISAGTGLIDGKFALDARLSKISSDGYIDRAFSDLKSFFVSGGYYTPTTVIKAVVFGGTQTTYQAWNGVPSVRLNNDLEGMKRYEEHWLYSPQETAEMIASNPRTYNLYTYDNQVDQYQQDHFQLHFSHMVNSHLNLNASLHYTIGLGYYEQFKADAEFADYGMSIPVIGGTEVEETDLVRKKWLDNDFYGGVFSLNYQKGRTGLSWGGGVHRYDGRHYGTILWAGIMGDNPKDFEWYRNLGVKTDFNSYVKLNQALSEQFNLFADLQYRQISYSIDGLDDDLATIDQEHDYHFFNPKAGIFYQPTDQHQAYLSFARASREPNRDNFTDASPGQLPSHETLNDLEAGYHFSSMNFTGGVNLFYMLYDQQLVLTGKINDVGAPIMVNVDDSYRAGVELMWGVKIAPRWRWDATATISRSRIKDFTEYMDDWDNGGQQAFGLGSTDLSFSPRFLANSQLKWSPSTKGSISLVSNYTGRQYIDNTASDDRSLDPWFVSNLLADYTFNTRFAGDITLRLMVNNLFDVAYESNAWVYSYILGGERYEMDGYFPQAGRHFMAGLDLKF